MTDAKPNKLIKALKAMGFSENGGTKHLKMVNGDKTIVIPIHGAIKRETVDRIRKQAGIDKKVFYSYNLS